MTGATLLVELLTEELPPKALPKLGQAFADGIAAGLRTRGLAAADGAFRWFATPRRLAVTLAGVLPEAAAREVTEKIMPVSVALDASGQPTAALTKKLEAKGIPLAAVAGFERRLDGKAEALFHTSTVAGAKLAEVLAGIVQDALKALPIPKVMRWGDGDATFVRPAHKLTMLHGTSVVPGSVLDIQSGRSTRGHRFMSRGDIDIASADAYEPVTVQRVVGEALSRIDPAVPASAARPMTALVADSMANRTLMLSLIAIAAAMALLLSAIGLYGVIAYVVGQRERELGIRVAIGASGRQIGALVMAHSVRLVGVGIVLGLAGAVMGTRVLTSFLFEVSPTDPAVLMVVVGLVAGLSLVATWVPTRRAVRIDPVIALRSD